MNHSKKRALGYAIICLGLVIAMFLVFLYTPAGEEVFRGEKPSLFGLLLPLVLFYTGWRWIR